ncbi:hypothetical protein ACHHYP_03250 [Achlya hypogyna]|uniref:Uncharacterized protein n=1 Tax=Achlya hypogyna TaxID=1202772 RepID=A0A1V9ZRE6_ACHHY|nr:hypothetical protein ACHHYP_03250 [Achlya hypogyna]
MMHQAAKAVRQRWPVAATVTATATALALAGLQAYTGKEAGKTASPVGAPSVALAAEPREMAASNPNAPVSPQREAQARRRSLVRLGYFRFLLIPVAMGIVVGAVAAANYFDALNVARYPSRADMLSRCSLWVLFTLEVLALSPLMTRSLRLHSFRANLVRKIRQSRKLRHYFSMHKIVLALTVVAPMIVLSYEFYTESIDVRTLQLYGLLASTTVLVAGILEYIYTLIQLNTGDARLDSIT